MPSDSAFCPTEIWLAALAAQGRSPKTIESYSAAVGKLRQWRQPPGGHESLDTLTRLEAMSFARHMTDTYTPGGAAVRLRALRAGWGWMVEEGLVEIQRVRPPEDLRARGRPANGDRGRGRARCSPTPGPIAATAPC